MWTAEAGEEETFFAFGRNTTRDVMESIVLCVPISHKFIWLSLTFPLVLVFFFDIIHGSARPLYAFARVTERALVGGEKVQG